MKEIKAELTLKEVLLKENYSEEEWNKLKEEYLYYYDFLLNFIENPVRDYLTYVNREDDEEDFDDLEEDYIDDEDYSEEEYEKDLFDFWYYRKYRKTLYELSEIFNFLTAIQDEDIKVINIDPYYEKIRNHFINYTTIAIVQCVGIKYLIEDIENSFEKSIDEYDSEELSDCLEEYFEKVDEDKLNPVSRVFIKNILDYDLDLAAERIIFYNSYISEKDVLDYIILAYEGNGENHIIKDPQTGRELVYESVFPLLSKETTSLKTYLHRYMDVQEVEEGEYRINWRLQKRNKN